MLHVLEHTLTDSLKMLPFLFLAYLLIEYIEHSHSKKIEKALGKSGKYGPFVGALLGLIPQCGFSVTASSFYSGRVITIGTLLSVYLATSDEAIPVLLTHPDNIGIILKLLLVKFIIAFLAGFIIDFILNKFHKKRHDKNPHEVETKTHEHIHKMCHGCDCENSNILKSTIKHTINIFLFIVLITFILNLAIHFIGEENLSKILMSGSIFQPFVAALIGLIPNCASSVLLTELYIAGNISFASIIAGLSTGAGVGLVVLFKTNKNIKQNLKILGLLYGIGVLSGIILEIIGILI